MTINYSDAELYSYMSSQAYFDNGGTPPLGWTKIGISPTNESGYFGVAFQNDITGGCSVLSVGLSNADPVISLFISINN